jgi:DNA-binding SARP family transcriptional activator/tetratricopeptide (TPR) repeat protein
MRFHILGPLEVHTDGGEPVRLRAAKQRTLLAVLLLHANRPVSADRLAEALWPGGLPQSAAANVRTYVAKLRRALCPADRQYLPLLDLQPGGYCLQVRPFDLDLLVFDDLVTRGCRALGSGDPAAAAGLLRDALELWRGSAAEDVTVDGDAAMLLAGLSQRHVAAQEAWNDARLALGEGADLVTGLRGLVAEHPLRERFHAQLMAALAGAGRQAEALAAYQDARRALVDQLGIEPGPQLQELQERILAGNINLLIPLDSERTSATARACPVPRQLPTGVGRFVGRADELKALSELLTHGAGAGGAVMISAIGGPAGIGKTALALHWAHQAAERFPDGQLYVNLRGFDPIGRVLSPTEAVRGFLEALGVTPQHIPGGLAPRTGLYRSLLAGRRLLVLLDNARDAEQVRPLLPGSPGCAAVVTSRNQLAGLAASEGARLLPLNLLDDTEARQLFTSRTGPARLAAEPHATDEIVALCAGLPLALVVVAARAAAQPGIPLAMLADALRRSRGLPDTLDTADPATDVRTVLSWSYVQLSGDAARLFRLIGLHPGPDLTMPAAASLAGIPTDRVTTLTAELARANLLTEHTPGRYSLHDLLRAYSSELTLAIDSDADRCAAHHRMHDHYLHTARTAGRLLSPHRDPLTVAPLHPGTVPEDLADYQQAFTWFAAEHQVLRSIVEHAAHNRSDVHAWQLPWSLSLFLDRQGHWHDWVAVQQIAVDAARRLGDRTAQARAHRSLGLAYGRLSRYEDAHTELRCALELFRQLGASEAQAHTHRSIAATFERQERYTETQAHNRDALELYRTIGHQFGQARALNGVGWAHARLGEYQQGLAHCEQALALQEHIGDRYGQAETWDSLGYARHHLGHYEQATLCYQRSLTLYRDLQDRYFQAQTLTHLGDTHHSADHAAAARRAWREALDIFDQLGHPDADQVRARLSQPDAFEHEIN